MYLHYTNKSPDKEFSVVPMLLQVRVFAGFVITALMVFISHDNNIINHLLIMVPYIMFAICMVFFYKKRIDFRLWFVYGAILNIGVNYYITSLPITMMVIDTILVLLIFLSPYIKQNYKKKGYVEIDISDV